MQKAIYLAQTAGVNLGYFFHWYLHGPYSPSLTKDEFAITMGISADLDESKGWKLDDASSQRLNRIRSLFSETKRDKLAKKLELLASAHFLIDRKQVSKADTADAKLSDEAPWPSTYGAPIVSPHAELRFLFCLLSE